MNRQRVFQAVLLVLAIIRLNLALLSVYLRDLLVLLIYLHRSGYRRFPHLAPSFIGFGRLGALFALDQDPDRVPGGPDLGRVRSDQGLQIIEDPRVAGLQEMIACKYFESRFGIVPVGDELAVLGRFPDVRQLGSLLMAMAGRGRRKRSGDRIYRCRFVYRSLIKGLGLKLAYDAAGNRQEVGKPSELRQIYPEELDLIREDYERERIREAGKKGLFELYLLKESRRMEIYLACVRVISGVDNHNERDLERLLVRLSGLKRDDLEGEMYE